MAFKKFYWTASIVYTYIKLNEVWFHIRKQANARLQRIRLSLCASVRACVSAEEKCKFYAKK